MTAYHLEVGIAACHAIAASHEETDWSHILELYDQLLALNPSPVVALNRAVAVSRCHGPAARSPTLNRVTSPPTATISPAPSLMGTTPGFAGNG